MTIVATTKMSSKGQVVIPEDIRDRLGLEAGSQFVVLGEGDAVILKIITPPDRRKFSTLLKTAQKKAKEVALKKEDLKMAIKKSRKK